ncbi:hypothetical protein NL108_016824 [Boleophthalmus pectinirostris]|nr:hypothetical protein NL108_016824 [Boleophthalmus pectinirostris]
MASVFHLQTSGDYFIKQFKRGHAISNSAEDPQSVLCSCSTNQMHHNCFQGKGQTNKDFTFFSVMDKRLLHIQGGLADQCPTPTLPQWGCSGPRAPLPQALTNSHLLVCLESDTLSTRLNNATHNNKPSHKAPSSGENYCASGRGPNAGISMVQKVHIEFILHRLKAPHGSPHPPHVTGQTQAHVNVM